MSLKSYLPSFSSSKINYRLIPKKNSTGSKPLNRIKRSKIWTRGWSWKLDHKTCSRIPYLHNILLTYTCNQLVQPVRLAQPLGVWVHSGIGSGGLRRDKGALVSNVSGRTRFQQSAPYSYWWQLRESAIPIHSLSTFPKKYREKKKSLNDYLVGLQKREGLVEKGWNGLRQLNFRVIHRNKRSYNRPNVFVPRLFVLK